MFEFLCQIGDIIDARDPESGAWFEAEIKKITKNTKNTQSTTGDKETEATAQQSSNPESADPVFTLPEMYQEDDGFLYHVLFEG